MAKQLSARSIKTIVRLAGEGTSLGGIAREVGCSRSTVAKYAPSGSFDRSRTQAAAKAHQLDAAAKRALLAERTADLALRITERMADSHLTFGWFGKDGVYEEKTLPEPPAAELRAFAGALASLTTQHLRLVDHDGDGGLDEARSVLDGFMDAVARRAGELTE